MSKLPTLNDVVLRALSGLPQAGAIRAMRIQWAADRLASLPRNLCERGLRQLHGLATPELSVLVHEARGLHDSRSCGRAIAQAKLLERAPDLSAQHPELDVALPLAASLLAQGHGSFAFELTHAAAAARQASGASCPWQLPDPAIQFVRMPAPAGQTRIGLAYVRPVADAAEADSVCSDAALALSIAAYSAVADGVLSSRPDALFVLNVVAPGLQAWAPLLRASSSVADVVRTALSQVPWAETPPVVLRPMAACYEQDLVRDAMKVGAAFWQRCVLGGAVPALPPRPVGAAVLLPGSEARAKHVVQQFVCMDRLAQGLSERMEVQRRVIESLAAEAGLSVGVHGVGAAQVVVREHLDVQAAAAELEARGIAPRSWSSVDWDVDGMRVALEGLGVDVSGFARAGAPDASRMVEALGLDAPAFHVREVTVARSATEGEPGLASADALADELVANVADLVFDHLHSDGMDAEGAAQHGARAA